MITASASVHVYPGAEIDAQYVVPNSVNGHYRIRILDDRGNGVVLFMPHTVVLELAERLGALPSPEGGE